MYCSNCGSRVDDTSKFCPSCGAMLNPQASDQTQATSDVPQATTPPAYNPPQGSPQTYNSPQTYYPPANSPPIYTLPTQGAAKVKSPASPKKRNILIISVAAVVVLICVIAGMYLLKNGGGSTSVVSGKVTDAAAYVSGDVNVGLENVQIAVTKGSKVVSKKKTNASGEYSFSLKEGSYTLTAEYDRYIAASFDFIVGSEENTYLPLTKLVAASDSPGTVSGTVIDSLTGEPVSGAVVAIKSSSIGSQFAPKELTTDEQGEYTAELPAGYYTAEINVIGYSKLSVQLVVIGGQTVENQNGALTPILEAGQLRVVLTWGENPLDLDSHLTGPSPEGKPFHIFYNHKTSDYNGETMAGLDLDDTTSYGPETTTIYSAVDGTYSFYVHDYSNRDSDNSTALANSGAVVQVYAGDKIIGQYNVPTDIVGTTWHVFDFTGGEISAAGNPVVNIEELNADKYDSGWTRIEGKKLSIGASFSSENISSMGLTPDMTLLDMVDKFGLPEYYDTVEALKADMQKGALIQEEDDDNPMGASWDTGKGITYARFETGTWNVKFVRLDMDVAALPFGLKSGMTLDDAVSAAQIDKALSDIGKLSSRDEIVKYCNDNKISGKDFEDGYVQVFLENGAFSYQQYTTDVDGFDELDYYLDFYTKDSIFEVTFTDGLLDGATISFSKPPRN